MSRAVHAGPTVAIIGGGIVGLATAWRLAQRGCEVTLLERGRVAHEASWAGAGMLAPAGEFDEPSELTSLALESRRLYPGVIAELEQVSGVSIDFQEAGALELAFDAHTWEHLCNRAAHQRSFGIEALVVPPADIATLWPFIATRDLAGGVFSPGDGLVAPRELAHAIRLACERHRVAICEHTAVQRLEIEPDCAVVHTAEGHRQFEVAVLAAGAWSSTIPIDGCPPVPPVEPVKGHLVAYQQPVSVCPAIVRCGDTYVLQRQSGLLIAGSTTEHAGFDRAVRAEARAELHARASRILPHLQEIEPLDSWIGFRPASTHLALGQWANSALFLNYGHYRNGILLAPVSAQRLSEAVIASWQTTPAGCYGRP